MRKVMGDIINNTARFPFITVGILLLAVSLSCNPQTASLFQLQLSSPDLIRIFLSHLTHWDLNQLLWDGLAFGMLSFLYERNYFEGSGSWRRGRLLMHIFISSLAISLSLILFPADFSSYRGLSGVCSGLYAALIVEASWAASHSRNRSYQWTVWLAGAALASKIIYESATGETLFTLPDSYQVAHQAHLVGAASSLVLEVIFVRVRLKKGGVEGRGLEGTKSGLR